MHTPPTATTEALAYPVLALARDSSISVARTADELVRCNALAFYSNRYFDGLVVIDAEAIQYVVTGAKPPPRHRGVRRWLVRLFNARFVVRLGLQRSPRNSLAEAKSLVAEWLRRAPEFWEASQPLEDWQRVAAATPSMRALIELFA